MGRVSPQAALIATGKKRCGRCGEVKELSQFYAHKLNAGNVTHYCRSCVAVVRRRSHLRTRYGISPEEYDRLVAEQGGRCAICGKVPVEPLPKAIQRQRAPRTNMDALKVDHDHTTGKVRGLLCSDCNTGLGSFQDDAAIMRAAVLYIERHKAQ